MFISFGKYLGKSVAWLVLKAPGYVWWALGQPDPGHSMERLKKGGIDLVLLDLLLPDCLAQETPSRIPALSHWCPVVVLSGTGDESLALRAIQEGALDYLVKGALTPELLVRSVCYAYERRRAEQLANRHLLLQTVIDNVPDQIYAKDAESRFIVANQALARVFGYDREQALIGKTDFDLFPHDVAAWFREEELSIMRSGEAVMNREATMPDLDGKTRWVITTKVCLHDSHGQVIGTVGINRDITERHAARQRLLDANEALQAREGELRVALADAKEAHTQLLDAQLSLVQAEKTELAGRLAAGIAHEVKNPLAVIATGLEFLQRRGADESADELPPLLARMRKAVDRADTVIRDLLDFSAPHPLDLAPHDLNALVHEALALVRHEIVRAHIRVHAELAPALPLLLLDRTKIEQVLVNLFLNAIHAMEGGGELRVQTACGHLSQVGRSLGTGILNRFQISDEIVVVEVLDTGHGIPEDKLTKIFDPFFTTKGPGKGTGLGLTVTRSIVELHGGTIEIANRHGGGVVARVCFCVPIGQKASAPGGLLQR